MQIAIIALGNIDLSPKMHSGPCARVHFLAGAAVAAGSGPGLHDSWKLFGYGYQMDR